MESELYFLTWEMMSTYSGALAMVFVLTQLTKTLPLIEKLPTQIWSYLVALAVMLPAQLFSGSGCTAADVVLVFFNAAVTALAANGGYDLMNRVTTSKTAK